MTIIAGLIGGASGTVGSLVSAAFPRLPSGPMIVLVAAAMFAFSAMAGAKRGIIWRILRRSQVNSRIALEHLLRGVYEIAEQNQATPIQDAATSLATLVRHRSWTTRQLRQVIRRAQRKGFVRWSADDKVQLTSIGLREAARLTRQHRLWELYLVNYAEVATARVDRGADDIEHVLEASTIDRLEELLETHRPTMVPASPHHIDPLTNEHGTTQ
jgi:manganese/zinc/iron transport system permease protein